MWQSTQTGWPGGYDDGDAGDVHRALGIRSIIDYCEAEGFRSISPEDEYEAHDDADDHTSRDITTLERRGHAESARGVSGVGWCTIGKNGRT